MKIPKRLFLIFCVILICCIILPGVAHALPPEDIDPTIDPCGDPDRVCPIDGGLTFMIIAGIAYGIKRVRQQFNLNSTGDKPVSIM